MLFFISLAGKQTFEHCNISSSQQDILTGKENLSQADCLQDQSNDLFLGRQFLGEENCQSQNLIY